MKALCLFLKQMHLTHLFTGSVLYELSALVVIYLPSAICTGSCQYILHVSDWYLAHLCSLLFCSLLVCSHDLIVSFSKWESMTETKREWGWDKVLDTSGIKEWFYIIKQIEVITASYSQGTNCVHSASLWSQRLQTVDDGLIILPQWNKC